MLTGPNFRGYHMKTTSLSQPREAALVWFIATFGKSPTPSPAHGSEKHIPARITSIVVVTSHKPERQKTTVSGSQFASTECGETVTRGPDCVQGSTGPSGSINKDGSRPGPEIGSR